ncbi:MAG: DNA polymerase I [Oligoflexales bacterium]
MGQPKLYVIDAMAMIYRSYYAIRAGLTRRDGLPTSAIYGCARQVLKILEEKPDYIVVASDCKEPTFRHEMYPEYKANRSEMPEDLIPQIPYVMKMFEAFGLHVLKEPGYEADDWIGSLVTQWGRKELDCYIVSGDKDFMQLITENVKLYRPGRQGQIDIVDIEGVHKKFQCTPHQVIDVLALMGDSSDNVPGVKGIGEKGAAKLIAQWGGLQEIYDNIDKITPAGMKKKLIEGEDAALLSQQLVTIRTDLLVPESVPRVEEGLATSERVLSFFRDMDFHALLPKESKVPYKTQQVAVAAEEDSAVEEIVYKPVSGTRHRVTSREALHTCIEALGDRFAFDTETTGLDLVADRPIGASFSSNEGEAWYVPFQADYLDDCEPDWVIEQLKKVFEDPKRVKIGHNLKYDLQMLMSLGIKVCGPFEDSMLASQLCDPSHRGHSLDALVLEHFKLQKISIARLIGEKQDRLMSEVPLPLLSKYAGEDADCTLRLMNVMLGKLEEFGMMKVFRDVEMPLIPILAVIEKRGIFVDTSALEKQGPALHARLVTLESDIHEAAGEIFNINSPKQLQDLLYDKLELHTRYGVKPRKTTHGRSTDSQVLEQMSQEPLVAKVLEYRGLKKLVSGWLDSLPTLIHADTSRVHSKFQQLGAATGRLSSIAPNLQNIPMRSLEGRKIRAAFTPQQEGWSIISADYDQVELRFMAHLADDQALKEAFQKGLDPHRMSAARVAGKAFEEVTDEERQKAKVVNYGLLYGMGARKLARETGLSVADAKVFIEKYFESFPNVKNWIDGAVAQAQEHECSRTLWGRRRPLPFKDASGLELSHLKNMAINTPVQGSVADTIKKAMIDIQNLLADQGLQAKMLIQVHDELVFECPDQEVPLVCELVKKAMEGAVSLSVPLSVQVGVGKNWLEAH